MIKKFEERIIRNKWLTAILGMTVLLRLPSLFEPYWYGDEAVYLTIGQALRKGVQLYSQIHDNKPPLIYLVAALTNGNLFWFKFIATVWSLVTIYVFYRLAKKLFEKRLWVLTATGLFAFLTAWTKLEGNIANAEIFFLLPAITTVLILWDKKAGNKKTFIAGIILGLGALFKMPVILEAGIWPILWIIFGEKDWWKKTIIFGIGIVVPILGSGLYFFMHDALREYLAAAWLQNLPYLTSWKATTTAVGIYSLKSRVAICCLVMVPIIGFAKRIGRRGVFLSLWALTTLFATLLSGRPYPHYLLQAAGAITLLPVIIVMGKKEEKIVGISLIALFTGAIMAFHFYNYPTVSYYLNFGKWITGKETKTEYFNWFDPQTNDGYKVAETIVAGSKLTDKIFVWGDTPMIYALTRRSPTGMYVVKYHIEESQAERQTMELLINEPPKYIVSYGKEEELPGLKGLLDDSYNLQSTIGQTKIYRLIFRI